MKINRPRIVCKDGVSLSVQANEYTYCFPRITTELPWETYNSVEVVYITKDDQPFTPPESWEPFSDGNFPSNIYGYVPSLMVERFIAEHRGQLNYDIDERFLQWYRSTNRRVPDIYHA